MRRSERILVFTAFWLSLFGPKIGGVADTSMFGGLLLFSALVKMATRRPPRLYFLVFVLAGVLLGQAILAAILNPDVVLSEIARYLRILISAAVLGYSAYILGARTRLTPQTFVDLLLAVLGTHALAVVIQALVPSTQYMFAPIFGYDKSVRFGRGFGFTAGFDAAGYLLCFALVLAAVAVYGMYARRLTVTRYVIYMAAFALGISLTSRGSMIIGTTIVAILIGALIWRGRIPAKVFALGSSMGFFWIVWEYLRPLLVESLLLNGSPNPDSNYTDTYATTSIGAWLDNSWSIPHSFPLDLVGSGVIPDYTDVGYVRLLGSHGYVGLFLMAALYLLIAIGLIGVWRRRNAFGPRDSNYVLLNATCVAGAIVVGLLFVMNVKGLYFGTRGFHEFVVLVSFYSIGRRTWLDVSRRQALCSSVGNRVTRSLLPESVVVGTRN